MKKFENEVCSYAWSIELENYRIKIEPCFYWFKEFDDESVEGELQIKVQEIHKEILQSRF